MRGGVADPSELSQEDQQHIIAWLKEKAAEGGEVVCSVCKHIDWGLNIHLVAPPRTTIKGGMLMGGVAYPHIMLTCTNCGNTLFFNAIAVKLPSVLNAKKKEESVADG